MTGDTTITVALEPEVDSQLARLAERTQRTPASVAAEAIAVHVARETKVIDAIHRGIADMKAGRLVRHDEAMAELDAAIEESP